MVHKTENKSDTEFSDSGKGQAPIRGFITFPDLDLGDDDNE